MENTVWILLGLGLIVTLTGSGNEANELHRTPAGKKLFRVAFGFGLISGALILGVLSGL